jgi:hypothetical protein
MIRLEREFRMNIFKNFTLKWWQAGIFKLALYSLGIAIGATWPEFFRGWTTLLLLVFLVSVSYVTYIWWKQ